MHIRDRIRELRRVPASELIANPKNYRTHPVEQKRALEAILHEVGYADALLARETPEGLILIDGHLRADTTPDEIVPVLVVDVTEEEADKLLAVLDPLVGMATHDDNKLAELLDNVNTDSPELMMLFEQLRHGIEPEEEDDAPPAEPLPAMELMPYEHYDYVLVLARDTHEWHELLEKLAIERVDSSITETKTMKKVGLGRCVSAERLLKLLNGYLPDDVSSQHNPQNDAGNDSSADASEGVPDEPPA